MRDHTKLRAFELADELALLAFEPTALTNNNRNREGFEWVD